ncbi:MAG: DUF2855 family protein, partial [Pseudomonadota bacterium]
MAEQFEVQKSHLQAHRVATANASKLAPGQVRAKIDMFAFTANNLTYAVAGDMLSYWRFFPAIEEDWGIIPVWGYADVVESQCAEVPIGERLYGYFPPANELIMKPASIDADAWFDGSPHRQSLPPLYNRYERSPLGAATTPEEEVGQALLGPLFMTSYLLFDLLKNREYYGVEQVVIVSASSKTSIGLAYALAGAGRTNIVGMTSSQNLEFVSHLGPYNSVVTYDNLAALDTKSTVVVDMAGNGELAANLKSLLGKQLK